MALRGVKPTTINKRLKALFYGPAGVGKTTAAIQFPKPYLIDTERGAENASYVKLLNDAGGAYWFTTDPDDMISEIRSLISERHDYQTLIIDPLTVIYNDLLDKGAEEFGTDFGRHKMPADRKIKHLLTLLLRLDMNVIITSHAKTRWERAKDNKGKDTVVDAGVTFDCYGKLDYLFDLVFEVQKRGKDRLGVVRKSRLTEFEEGAIFPFSYAEIATRYDRAVLERAAEPIALASQEQVAQLTALLDARKDGDILAQKMLTKAQAESISEMSADSAQKMIDYLTGGAVVATTKEDAA